ncbi:MAG: hypothetical protein AAB785_00985 [Patescibacteria group bacterium]
MSKRKARRIKQLRRDVRTSKDYVRILLPRYTRKPGKMVPAYIAVQVDTNILGIAIEKDYPWLTVGIPPKLAVIFAEGSHIPQANFPKLLPNLCKWSDFRWETGYVAPASDKLPSYLGRD